MDTRFYKEEDNAAAATLFAIITTLILEACEARNKQHQWHQLYLCRQELILNPRVGTPWQRLWESQNDHAFIMTMGFDVATFWLLLEGPRRFGECWETRLIQWNDVSNAGHPRLQQRSLDGAGALGLVLHYLGSAMLDVSLQQIFALTPSVLSQYLDFAEEILYKVLLHVQEAQISMPRTESDFKRLSTLITQHHPLLIGAFGSVDGLSLCTQVSDDPELKNVTYNGWKSDHHINNVLVFSPEGMSFPTFYLRPASLTLMVPIGIIINAVINSPGSWHDARIAQPIFETLWTRVPHNYFLVSDTAFPHSTQSIEGKIHAPLKTGKWVPNDPILLQHLLTFNWQLLSYCQTAEWGMCMLQGSLGVYMSHFWFHLWPDTAATLKLVCISAMSTQIV